MANQPLALESLVPESIDKDVPRRDLQRLEDENRGLRREIEDLTEDKKRLTRTIENLRRNLSPLHTALRVIFGEIELAVGEEAATTIAASSIRQNGSDPRWDSYKSRFPGAPTEIIDALLVHGEMNFTNLAGFLHRDPRTIRAAEAKLRSAGATALDNGMLRLKR